MFILDLSGTNSITGAGRSARSRNVDSLSADLTIENVKNVSLAEH